MNQRLSVEQLDVDRLLKEWRWLCPTPLTLVERNVFGDLFLRTAIGKVMWLNVGSGTLVEVADSEEEFRKSLELEENRALWLAEAEVESCVRRGIRLNDNQCIGFKIPTIFAESASVPDNAYVADLYEQISFLGELHRQIASEPDGAKVRLTIDERPRQARALREIDPTSEALSEQKQNGRPLRDEERALILAMMPKETSSVLHASLAGAFVVDLQDGAMGSIRFVRGGRRRRASGVAEAHYNDADGVLVSIELNADESGELFELDFWKVDFSPLQRYPHLEDLRIVR